jgi:cysteine synthase
MMKEAAPSISRVAVLCYRERPNDRGGWRRELDAAGKDATLVCIICDRGDRYLSSPLFKTTGAGS